MIALTVLATTLLNAWINPLRLTPSPWTDDDFDTFREIGDQTARTAKAGLGRSREWDAVALGSSRVNLAVDPYDGAWDGARVLNFGLSSGTLPESAIVLHYLLGHQDIRTVVLGVDAGDLTSPETTLAVTDFLQSPLSPDHQKVERELRYWTGFSSLAASLETLDRQQARVVANHSPRGHHARPESRPYQARRILESYIPRALAMIHRRGDSPQVDPAKAAALDDILMTCRRRGIRLVVFMPPNYGLFAATFFVAGDADPAFGIDRRHIVEAVARANASDLPGPPVEFWDFHDFHPLNTEKLPPLDERVTRLRSFIDATHANAHLGSVMLARMLGKDVRQAAASDYGTKVDFVNIDQHLEDVRQGFEDYRQQRPGDFALLREAIENAD